MGGCVVLLTMPMLMAFVIGTSVVAGLTITLTITVVSAMLVYIRIRHCDAVCCVTLQIILLI